MLGFLSLSGIFLSSYTRNLFAFLLLYAGFNGIGSGAMYILILIAVWEWFPAKKGFVTGVTLTGFGLGLFVFSFVSTKLVNPDSKNPSIYDPDNDVTYYDGTVADRVPFMLRVLAYIWSGLVFIAFVLVTRAPKEKLAEANIVISDAENADEKERCGSLSESSLPKTDDTPEEQLRKKKPE